MDCCDLPKTRVNKDLEMVCPVHCSKCGHDRKYEDHLDFCSLCYPDGPCVMKESVPQIRTEETITVDGEVKEIESSSLMSWLRRKLGR